MSLLGAFIEGRPSRRRIRAGYFNDNLSANWQLPVELLLKDESDFEKEIFSFLKYGSNTPFETSSNLEQEADILAITNFKYKGFSQLTNASNTF